MKIIQQYKNGRFYLRIRSLVLLNSIIFFLIESMQINITSRVILIVSLLKIRTLCKRLLVRR